MNFPACLSVLALGLTCSTAAHAEPRSIDEYRAQVNVTDFDDGEISSGIQVAEGEVSDDVIVSATYGCTSETNFAGFWTAAPVCEGAMRGYRQYGLEPGMQRYAGTFPTDLNIAVEGKTGTATELFTRLLQVDEPKVEIDGRVIELQWDRKRAVARMKAVEAVAADAVDKQRTKQAWKILAIVIGAGFAAWIARRIYRSAKRMLPSAHRALHRAWTAFSALLRAMTRPRVHHVVIQQDGNQHSTPRASASLTEAAALRSQITQAMENGDFELAKTLMSVLQKLEGDVATAQ